MRWLQDRPSGGDLAGFRVEQQDPNIVVIMGMTSACGTSRLLRGTTAGRTPSRDKIAKEGMSSTDDYAEARTAGRADFITGELSIGTGMPRVGQAGASVGLPAEEVTTATLLKSMGDANGETAKITSATKTYACPQCTASMNSSDIYTTSTRRKTEHILPPSKPFNVVGPRNMIHSRATDKDDPTETPRWGKIGKQRIEDVARSIPNVWNWSTPRIVTSRSILWRERKRQETIFVWLNPTGCIVTHLSPKHEPYAMWTMAGRKKKRVRPSR